MPVASGRRSGIDVGGTKCLGVVWHNGKIVQEVRRDTPKGADDIIQGDDV
jgi:predicted NBD/HSP70 family sugar kinase